MNEPSKEELASALEQLAEGAGSSGAEAPIEPGVEATPVPSTFTPSDLGAGAAVQTDPPAVVETEAEAEAEAADEAMVDMSPAETPPMPVIPAHLRRRAALYRSNEFRQTIIPILLTCGLLSLAFASVKFVLGPDSILSDLPMWLPLTLTAAGIVLLLMAALNMLAVKHSR